MSAHLYATSPHPRTRLYHEVADVEVSESAGSRVVRFVCGQASTIARVFTRSIDARTVLGSRRKCQHCTRRRT